jgi:hypothetical protein
LDEILKLLRIAKNEKKVDSCSLTKELFDLCSMALNHLRDELVPAFQKKQVKLFP